MNLVSRNLQLVSWNTSASLHSIFRLVLLLFLFISIHAEYGRAFWNDDQVVVNGSQITNIKADVECRIASNKVIVPKLRRPGVDGWLTYVKQVDNKSMVMLKYYQLNNDYPNCDTWFPAVLAHNPDYLVNYENWGQSLQGYYYLERNDTSPGKPGLFCSYMLEADNNQFVALSRTWINGSDQYVFREIDYLEPNGSINDTCKTELVVVDREIFLIWDSINDQSNIRSIYVSHVNVITNEAEDGTISYTYDRDSECQLVTGIMASESVQYNVDIHRYHKGEKIFRGVLCWQIADNSSADTVHARGFGYNKNGVGFNLPVEASCLLSTAPSGSQFASIALSKSPTTQDNNQGVFYTVSWLKTDPMDSTLMNRCVHVKLDETGGLLLATDGQDVDLTQPANMCAVASDNGFMRPIQIDRDRTTGRIAIAQMGNHRINTMNDPFDNTAGAWISELYKGSEFDCGSLTRVHHDTVTQMRQMMWLVYPVGSGSTWSLVYQGIGVPENYFKDEDSTILETELLEVQTEAMPVSYVGKTLNELLVTSDPFSSFYCFYLISDASGNQEIRWNCDGLLLREHPDGSVDRDRLTHPYDIDFIPEVWTPTPTPTNYTATPAPTWTPREEGMWVADMAGHRVLRLSHRGHILAQSYTEDVTDIVSEDQWSEYENFDVISPNDVSAAYDGSCWAIDWGRNKVVKFGVNGEIIAETVPCEFNDPEYCRNINKLIHPVAIDCAGDPNSCFVADYEGNQVYKLTVDGYEENNEIHYIISTHPSNADYFRPKTIEVTRKLINDELKEIIWVADRWNSDSTPAPNWTFTPIPTSTPTPIPPTPTVAPPASTPYPENQRISQNEFGLVALNHQVLSSIPVSISAAMIDTDEAHCWIADRDAGWSKELNNYVRWLVISNGTLEQRFVGKEDGVHICRPVDIEVITSVSTPTPAP